MNAILLMGPSVGYELSVYDSLGIGIWGLGIGSFVCALVAIISQPECFRSGRRRFALAASVLLACLVIVALPFARGYGSLGRHDELTHIGIIRELIQEGNLWLQDFYPALHLETVALHFSANLDLLPSPLTLVPVYAITFALAVYGFSRCLFEQKHLSYFTLVLVTVPLAYMTPRYFTPNEVSFAVIPLVLYSLMRATTGSNRQTWMIVLCIFLFVSIIYHPQLCIVLSAAILLMPFSRWITERKSSPRGLSSRRRNSLSLSTPVFSLCFLWICYFAWLSRFALFSRSINDFVRAIFYGLEESPSMTFAGYAVSRLSVTESVVLVLNSYGMDFLIIFGAITFLVLTRTQFQSRLPRWHLTYLSISLFAYLIISISTFVGNFVLPFGRVFVLVLLYSQLLFVMTATSYFSAVSRKKAGRRRPFLRKLTVLAVLLMFILLSIYSFFPSPRVGQYNLQVTYSTFDGNTWLIEHKDENTTVMVILGLFYRYLDATIGPSESRVRQDALWYVPEASPPPHLGYDISTVLGSQYSAERFLCFDQAVIEYYSEVFPTQGSFNLTDFDALSRDPSALLMMDNGCLVCYLVIPS